MLGCFACPSWIVEGPPRVRWSGEQFADSHSQVAAVLVDPATLLPVVELLSKRRDVHAEVDRELAVEVHPDWRNLTGTRRQVRSHLEVDYLYEVVTAQAVEAMTPLAEASRLELGRDSGHDARHRVCRRCAHPHRFARSGAPLLIPQLHAQCLDRAMGAFVETPPSR